ncbi:MAG TPA: hypothetical protein GXX72_07190 [Clostridiaceae bacterium]|nr:hypothetical protein [Clostridiaceae bacterium]
MIDAIVGVKGSGKTPRLLEEMTKELMEEGANIIFIEYGKRLDSLVPYQVRLIDITEYPVRGYDGLLAFLSGLNAKDYDISHIYIDSIYKVVGDDNLDHLADFFRELEKLAKQCENRVTITITAELESLPKSVQAYARKN